MIELKFSFDDSYFKKINHAGNEIVDSVDKIIQRTAMDVRNTAVAAIQRGARTGNKYTRYKPKRTGIASAPGEYPKSDTGNLASHIYTNHIRKLVSDVGTTVKYGEWLETGTAKMQPRPWLQPSLETWKEWMMQDIKVAIEKAFKS